MDDFVILLVLWLLGLVTSYTLGDSFMCSWSCGRRGGDSHHSRAHCKPVPDGAAGTPRCGIARTHMRVSVACAEKSVDFPQTLGSSPSTAAGSTS